jgi:hypothetical protein
MPGTELNPADRRLLAEVRTVLDEVDPVPDAVLNSARAALTWLTIDAELAALAEDSALASAGVRSTALRRSLTFESDTGVLAFEVSEDDGNGATRQIVGQADRPADLTVRHNGDPITVATDEQGRFRIEGVQAGPVSLHCVFRDSPDSPIVTSWIVV